MEPIEDYRIFVLSDGTGQTGKRVLEAALLQFDLPVMIIRIPHLRSVEQVNEVVADAARNHSMIVYTLVSVELRQAVHIAGMERGVIVVDLLGGLLAKLQDFLHRTPWGRPGLLYQTDAGYYQRVDAMEYTVQHDDGQKVDDLSEADLVLVGPSRTSKTPVSFYLAYRGWKVANVPIVLGLEPPEPLRELDPRKVVGLTTDPQRLALIRQERLKNMGAQTSSSTYADLRHIQQEVRYSLRLCKTNRWPVVNVTGKAVEETANEVLNLVAAHPPGVEE
ncbi:MAG TPA: pyruvate, water dikinase regulatory protein, partial [Candidatus Tectomicrobia bacterium]|nr:pyruvate, water dikinase regulatory protein [Candidatus Tectomicrobia bacterium]